MSRDLKRSEEQASISGTIFRGAWTGKTVRIYLFQKAEDYEFPLIFRSLRLAESPRNYSFSVPEPGQYLVGAFEDVNDDGHWNRGEPVATVNDFEVIDVAASQKLHDLNMELGHEIPPRLAQFKNENIKLESLVEFGDLVDLEDEKFGPESGPLGMWQPLVFLDRYNAGVYLLERFDPKRTPVLFIHGMSGYPQEFRELIESLDRTRFQAWIVHYPSGARLANIVRGMHPAVEMTLRSVAPAGPQPDVFLVAHSMGGLVAHQFLREHYSFNQAPSLSCLITLASPLGGIPSADAGVKHAPSVVPSWRDVGPTSQFVTDLFDLPFPDQVPYFLYFGYGGSVTFGRSASDGTVRLHSQLRPEAQETAWGMAGYDATHTGILKLPSVAKRLNQDLSRCRAQLETRRERQLREAMQHRDREQGGKTRPSVQSVSPGDPAAER